MDSRVFALLLAYRFGEPYKKTPQRRMEIVTNNVELLVRRIVPTVDEEYRDPGYVLEDEDELSLFLPVTGPKHRVIDS